MEKRWCPCPCSFSVLFQRPPARGRVQVMSKLRSGRLLDGHTLKRVRTQKPSRVSRPAGGRGRFFSQFECGRALADDPHRLSSGTKGAVPRTGRKKVSGPGPALGCLGEASSSRVQNGGQRPQNRSFPRGFRKGAVPKRPRCQASLRRQAPRSIHAGAGAEGILVLR